MMTYNIIKSQFHKKGLTALMVSGAIGAAIAFMLTVMPTWAFSGPDKQLTGDCRSLTGTRNHDKKNKALDEHGKQWKKLEQLMGEKDAAAICNEKGEIIFSKNATILAAPASTLKILTSLEAIHYLGDDFRFKTDLFLDKKNNLKVKGYGDPLFVSESIHAMARQLDGLITGVNDIVLDDTYFSKPIFIPGRKNSLQPYDAPAGAVCANFNTVNFVFKNGSYKSGEPQTPLVPFALKKINPTRLKTGRITLSENSNESLYYAGELIRYFLKQNNIAVKGRIKPGRVDLRQDRHIMTYHSIYTLKDVLTGLLEHSNNFMANQLILAVGATQSGPPATLEKGIGAIRRFAEKHIGITDFEIVEGSGLSKQNRFSACQMLRILKAFQPHMKLLRQEKAVYYKTGTLKKIRTRAGFIMGDKGRVYRFAVFFNTANGSIERAMKIIVHNLGNG